MNALLNISEGLRRMLEVIVYCTPFSKLWLRE
jgi:hypothetical protein